MPEFPRSFPASEALAAATDCYQRSDSRSCYWPLLNLARASEAFPAEYEAGNRYLPPVTLVQTPR